MSIAAGSRFNHYEILSPLGTGGVGEVYRAKDTRLHHEVAIKVLPADFARDAERLRRFEQEARATSALNHPNILTRSADQRGQNQKQPIGVPMIQRNLKLALITICFALLATVAISASGIQQRKAAPPDVYTRIIQLEDERSLGNGELEALLQYKLPAVRYRAALAIGRIGDKHGTAALLKALETATAPNLRLITVFALGEMEDTQATPALLKLLERKTEAREVRARAAEALGKIASVEANATALGQGMVEKINQLLIAQLPDPRLTLLPGNKLLTLLTITALMRVRLPSCVEPLARQLKSRDAGVRAQAANALARVRHPINSAVPTLLELLADRDINVRANSARALGREASACEPLIKLLNDPSEHVQVSAVRGLASLADRRAVAPLLAFGEELLKQYGQAKALGETRPPQINLLLELATALSSLKDESSLPLLHRLRTTTGMGAYTEIEAALVKFGEKEFWFGLNEQTLAPGDWRRAATLAQALSELGSERAKAALLRIWEQAEQGKLDARVVPALLRALNRVKYPGLPALARRQLTAKEVIVRVAAANALTDLNDENFDALASALEQSRSDTQNDARLALLNAIAKYKTPRAVNLVKPALGDSDQRVRRRTADLLRQMGVGGEEIPAEAVAAPHDLAYYERVRRLLDKKVTVTIYTSKGPIKVEMFAKDSPMTVDNFIELAKRKYFDGIVFHRIVPNFVAQGGDPRGDGNGGPGYQIRCEINTQLYQRGSVGMALSGKDTGGSQFFFCHAPQPHLDGGYTIFGQVIAGMEAVDKLTRNDVIERIEVSER